MHNTPLRIERPVTLLVSDPSILVAEGHDQMGRRVKLIAKPEAFILAKVEVSGQWQNILFEDKSWSKRIFTSVDLANLSTQLCHIKIRTGPKGISLLGVARGGMIAAGVIGTAAAGVLTKEALRHLIPIATKGGKKIINLIINKEGCRTDLTADIHNIAEVFETTVKPTATSIKERLVNLKTKLCKTLLSTASIMRNPSAYAVGTVKNAIDLTRDKLRAEIDQVRVAIRQEVYQLSHSLGDTLSLLNNSAKDFMTDLEREAEKILTKIFDDLNNSLSSALNSGGELVAKGIEECSEKLNAVLSSATTNIQTILETGSQAFSEGVNGVIISTREQGSILIKDAGNEVRLISSALFAQAFQGAEAILHAADQKIQFAVQKVGREIISTMDHIPCVTGDAVENALQAFESYFRRSLSWGHSPTYLNTKAQLDRCLRNGTRKIGLEVVEYVSEKSNITFAEKESLYQVLAKMFDVPVIARTDRRRFLMIIAIEAMRDKLMDDDVWFEGICMKRYAHFVKVWIPVAEDKELLENAIEAIEEGESVDSAISDVISKFFYSYEDHAPPPLPSQKDIDRLEKEKVELEARLQLRHIEGLNREHELLSSLTNIQQSFIDLKNENQNLTITNENLKIAKEQFQKELAKLQDRYQKLLASGGPITLPPSDKE